MTKTMNIVRPFTLNLGDPPRDPNESEQDYVNRVAALGPRTVSVVQGIQQLPDEVADHWFTKANSVQGQLDPHEYAAQLRSAAQMQRTRAEEAAALADAMEAQADEAEQAAEDSGVEPGAMNPDPSLKVVPPPDGAAPTVPQDADAIRPPRAGRTESDAERTAREEAEADKRPPPRRGHT